jgi:site-specific recombinase XerD
VPRARRGAGDDLPSSSASARAQAADARRPRAVPARALSEPERQAILAELHSERFLDCSPAQVWATLSTRARGADHAKLRTLRFHDLRHTFGSLAINTASIIQVQAWMGHADVNTTMRYLHHKSRADDARLLSAAFETESDRV